MLFKLYGWDGKRLHVVWEYFPSKFIKTFLDYEVRRYLGYPLESSFSIQHNDSLMISYSGTSTVQCRGALYPWRFEGPGKSVIAVMALWCLPAAVTDFDSIIPQQSLVLAELAKTSSKYFAPSLIARDFFALNSTIRTSSCIYLDNL